MGPAGRREAERQLLREPLLALVRALDGSPRVAAAGNAEVGGVAVEQLVLWIDGWTTTFGLAADGRVRTAVFRGHGPQQWFGEVSLVLDDHTELDGVIVPRTMRGTFGGAPAQALAEARTDVRIDAELGDAFAAPPPRTPK